ncbi:MAG TPA: hypothetical protein VGJ91_18085 [Polyangiaceae bacterium]
MQRILAIGSEPARGIFLPVDPFTAPREFPEQLVPRSKPDWPVLYARRAGFGVYAVAVISGFAYGVRPTDAVRLLTALAASWVIAYHCALDARAHQRVFPHSFWLMTSMSWPLAPLFHFVRVRGASGALRYALHAVLVVLCWVASGALGTLLFHR